MKDETNSSCRRSRLWLVLATILVLLPVAAGTLRHAVAEPDSFYREVTVFSDVLSLIRSRYVDETDTDSLFTGAFDGTVDALDPLATFVPADRIDEYNAFLGVGRSRSGVFVARERGILYVVAVAPESPGAELGLETGDILAEIDGRSTRLLGLWQVQTLLAGEPGTVLAIEWLRQGQQHEGELVLAGEPGSATEAFEQDGVQIVRISWFDQGTVESLAELLSSEAAGGSLILDLRGAAGGSDAEIAASLRAADLFVDGSLARLAKRGEAIEAFPSERPAVWSGEVLVLTNRGTQGAAELFAAILGERLGARRVGGATFGHAGRRTGRTLANGAMLFLTDAFYEAREGQPLNERLEPDVEVRASAGRTGAGETQPEKDDDPVLERALELLAEEAIAKAA